MSTARLIVLQAALVEEHEIARIGEDPRWIADVKADELLASEAAAAWICGSHLARRIDLFAEGMEIFLMNFAAASITACG
jgi:hypothetical protein